MILIYIYILLLLLYIYISCSDDVLTPPRMMHRTSGRQVQLVFIPWCRSVRRHAGACHVRSFIATQIASWPWMPLPNAVGPLALAQDLSLSWSDCHLAVDYYSSLARLFVQDRAASVMQWHFIRLRLGRFGISPLTTFGYTSSCGIISHVLFAVCAS